MAITVVPFGRSEDGDLVLLQPAEAPYGEAEGAPPICGIRAVSGTEAVTWESVA